MSYTITFKMENNPFILTRITHMFSRLKCQIVDFHVKQMESDNLLSIHIKVRGDQKMYTQFVLQLNHTVGVFDINTALKETAVAY